MEKGYYVSFCIFYPINVESVAIHNKNGKGLLLTIDLIARGKREVAIHNKNGKGLLQANQALKESKKEVAIHNKNGKGLLQEVIGIGDIYSSCCRNPQ